MTYYWLMCDRYNNLWVTYMERSAFLITNDAPVACFVHRRDALEYMCKLNQIIDEG